VGVHDSFDPFSVPFVTRNRSPLARLLRTGVRTLPAPARDRIRSVYRVAVAPDRPQEPHVELSSDVADRDALFDYLIDTDVFGAAQDECAAYVNDAIERIRITLSLIEQVVARGRVLELGSNPYLITRLLKRRGLDVTSANWFGDPHIGARGTQVVTGPRSGERHEFVYDHFNVETDRFPYDDGQFDLVLCCEILEHLPHDPVHMLAEIHRVLRRDSGRLLLTTPNPVRLDNLTRMLRGDNVYEELSGYGTYGRHNREYTTGEVRDLLDECGFADVYVFAMDIHPHTTPPEVRLSTADLRGRGDNLFAIGRSLGDPRWPYPRWLYASRHALARRVRSDLRMGYNDVLQSSGFHELESFDGTAFRWTGSSPARARVSAPDRRKLSLHLEGCAPPPAAGASISITARLDGEDAAWTVACDGARFSLRAPVHVKAGDHEVEITTDRTWRPADAGLGDDVRTLGVQIERVAIEG
jgi:SAM-dependent methyltransferase